MVKSLPYILKRGLLLLLIVNAVYLTSCYLYYKDDFSIEQIYKNPSTFRYIYVDKDKQVPTISFMDEIKSLFAKVERNENNRFWLKDTALTNTELTVNPNHFFPDSPDSNAWVNKNTLFYDARLTLSLYLDYIRSRLSELQKPVEVQKQTELSNDPEYLRLSDFDKKESQSVANPNSKSVVSVPFHWADWLDLTSLNLELSLSTDQRNDCNWVEAHVDKGNRFRPEHLHCKNNEDLSPKELHSFGFDRHEQLPGLITDGFSLNRATIDVRIAQARSYCLTHMPVPYKLMFLNKHNGTYEVNVDQEGPNKRIVKTDLMRNYLENNNMLKNDKGPSTIKLDPVKEFRKLKQEIKPTYLTAEEDIYNVYNITHTFKSTHSKSLPIPKEAFHYDSSDIDKQIEVLNGLNEYIPLDHVQLSYLRSLILSKERTTFTEDVFFRQATLLYNKDKKNVDHDRGYHYDWRFFVGTLSTYKGWTKEELTLRQEIILDRLARTWFRFAEEKGLLSWIMHGPLLSWYWDGLMFPFDNDLDIQMPARDLARLGELHNQTLVIEDIEEGFGKYLIDVGTFVHNRDISRKENHIDARLIDVDTGLYIDITGLGVSNAEIPEEFRNDKELVKISKEDPEVEIYNDRRKHFYKHEQLSPLRYSMLGGVPVFLPNDITKRLLFEYPKGMLESEYNKWYFIPKINLWILKDRLVTAFDDNDYRKITDNKNENGKIDDNKLHDLILDINEEQVIQLLKHDDEILCEYYKTKQITDIHEVEKLYMFTTEETVSSTGEKKVEVKDKLLSGKSFEDYNKFINENIRMTKPLRKSLFQFEYVDQPLHHVEFVEEEELIESQNS